MKRPIPHQTLTARFPRNALLRIERSEGFELALHTGSVWLTQQDDTRDIVIGAGESFLLDRSGRAILQVLADAEIVFTRHRAPSRSWRLEAIRRGFEASVRFFQRALQAARARGAPPAY